MSATLPPTLRVPQAEYERVLLIAERLTVRRWSGRKLPACLELDDLLQAARLGVYMAATRHDRTRDHGFCAFGCRYAAGHVLRCYSAASAVGPGAYWRTLDPWQYEALRLSYQPRGEDGERLENLIAAPGDDYARVDDVVTARGVLSRLPERDQEILRLRYLDDLTLREVGAQVGLSWEGVRYREAAALKAAREALSL